MIRAGEVSKAAASLITEHIGASDDVIRKAVGTYGKLANVEQFDDDLLIVLAADYAEKMGDIFAVRDL